jgi:monothiol bacilliredoxin
MDWTVIDSPEAITSIKNDTSGNLFLIFKHSTRCSISSMAKSRLERNWLSEIPISQIFYLDLIQHRSISNQIAEDFSVVHESPQIIVVKNGKAVYTASHNLISPQTILNELVLK